MKNHLACLFLAMVGILTTGCSTLQEAVYGRPNQLEPLANATLGSTSRDEIVQKYGSPEEVDKRWFDSQEVEVYFYHDRDYTNNGEAVYRFLACEFAQGVLRGYSYHDSSEPTRQSFDENERGKLTRGKSTRLDVEKLLGAPKGRALLPTTINLPALGIKLGGAPFPVAKLPEDAREIWQYYSQNLDVFLNKSAQKTLAVFFDSKGVYVGSSLIQELVGLTR